MIERYPEICHPSGREILIGNDLLASKLFDCAIYVTCASENSPDLSQENRWNEAPRKIKTRLKLIKSKLNTLPTVIIHPSATQKLADVPLSKIVESLNTLNVQLGLPGSKDLIIRSARAKSFTEKVCSPSFSEPALLIRALGENGQRYAALSHDDIPRSSLYEFVKSLGGRVFLIVHLDHCQLQSQAIHGALMEGDAGSELALATDVLHARNITQISTDVPAVRIDTDHFDELFDFDPLADSWLRPKITFLNVNKKSESKYLLQKAWANASLILTAYKRVENVFEKNSVMEFRIYPLLPEDIGKNFQVLDVNKRF